MDKITHTSTDMSGTSDDMRVLNYLVETIQGLRPVSGSAQELALPDPEDFDIVA